MAGVCLIITIRTNRSNYITKVHLCADTHRKTAFAISHTQLSRLMCLDCKLKWTQVRKQITKLAKLLLLDFCEDTGDNDGFTTKTSQLTLQIFLQLSLISLSLPPSFFPSHDLFLYWKDISVTHPH